METRQPIRLTRSLVVAAVVAALLIGVLIGGVAGLSKLVFGSGPDPQTHRLVEPGIDAGPEPAGAVRRALCLGHQLAPVALRLSPPSGR